MPCSQVQQDSTLGKHQNLCVWTKKDIHILQGSRSGVHDGPKTSVMRAGMLAPVVTMPSLNQPFQYKC